MKNKTIEIYDTTLRDGTQAEEIALSLEDKLRLTLAMDKFGIHYVEGGWPGSNPKDAHYFQEVRKLDLKQIKIAAFGSTRRASVKAEEDKNLKLLVESKPDVITIFGKSWNLHVTEALNISLEENLVLIEDSVAYLVAEGFPVFFDAEHFFDGYKADATYALQVLQAAEKGGAEIVVLCDTNGGTLPTEMEEILKDVKRNITIPFGIHTHNDSELAVANSLLAVQIGASQVQGTINGYGERCGNANLCSILPNLVLKMGFKELGERLELSKLTHLAQFVSEIANLQPRKHQAFVGQSAFAHKGGIHVSAIRKNASTYEHIPPSTVGNTQRVLVSDLSGRANIEYKAKEFGIQLNPKDPAISAILAELKQLEDQGFVYEGAEASFKMLMLKHLNRLPDVFEIDRLQISVLLNDITQNGIMDETITEAVIKLKTPDGKIVHTAAEGNGPVHALDNALRKALVQFYPAIATIKLVDFKVRILDEKAGTEAKTRVLIQSTDCKHFWGTVGVSGNVIEASWYALLDSIKYKLLLDSEGSENTL